MQWMFKLLTKMIQIMTIDMFIRGSGFSVRKKMKLKYNILISLNK